MRILYPGFINDYCEKNEIPYPFTIEWDFCGERKGHMCITYDFLPLSKKDMKILCNGMPEETACKIADFCKDYLSFLDNVYRHHENDCDYDKKERTAIETEQKRFLAMVEFLSDNYNTAPATVQHEIIKTKKAVLYVIDDKNEVLEVDGVIFEKYGELYGAYKHKQTRKTYIIDVCSGLPITNYKGVPSKAPTYLHDRLCEKLADIYKNSGYKDLCDKLKKMITDNGYTIPDYMPEVLTIHPATVKPEPPEDVTKSTDTSSPCGRADDKKARQARQPENTPKTANKPPYKWFVYTMKTYTPIEHAKTPLKSTLQVRVYKSMLDTRKAVKKRFIRFIYKAVTICRESIKKHDIKVKSPPHDKKILLKNLIRKFPGYT